MKPASSCTAGLIPARAGTTRNSGTHSVNARAHPRSRGDHAKIHPKIQGIGGSSPLARGPRASLQVAVARDGLIPARAGTTKLRQIHPCDRGAHPRSRGDHLAVSGSSELLSGSSPLARGPPDELITPLNVVGLIPARAGTTSLPPHPVDT